MYPLRSFAIQGHFPYRIALTLLRITLSDLDITWLADEGRDDEESVPRLA